MIQHVFAAFFSGEGDFVILVIEVESTEIHQIWRGHGAIIDALNVLDFLLRFKTGVTQRRLKSELKAKFRSFPPPVKLGEGRAKYTIFN